MRQTFLVILGLLMCVGITACTREVRGGDPAVPLSSSNGINQVFPVPEATMLTAITNRFERGYRGMILYPALSESYLVPNWHPTNGYVLFPILGPIASVPLQGTKQVFVPYVAYFYIATFPVDSNRTKVQVRTVLAKVIDGKEVGVHGGWANHDRVVPPVLA